jgi:hypothetical protein
MQQAPAAAAQQHVHWIYALQMFDSLHLGSAAA